MSEVTVTLKDLVVAGLKQTQLEEDVERLEAELKAKEHELLLHTTMVVPNMMSEVGIESFTLPGGRTIAIENKIYAKLPKDAYEAFAWLRSHNMDGIIKTKVTLDFGKGEEKTLEAALEMLQRAGLVPMVKSDIHHMTLKATVKEQLERGSDIPLEAFGAGLTRTSVVKG